jgi:hypothetical protein
VTHACHWSEPELETCQHEQIFVQSIQLALPDIVQEVEPYFVIYASQLARAGVGKTAAPANMRVSHTALVHACLVG